MSSKNAKQKRAQQQSELSRYMREVGNALESVKKALSELNPSVVGTFHIGPFSGEPDAFSITLIVPTDKDLKTAQQLQLIEKVQPIIEHQLHIVDYPVEAIQTFEYFLVSQEAIDKAGGKFSYFR